MPNNKIVVNNLESYSGKISAIAETAGKQVNTMKSSLDSISQDWSGKSYSSFSSNYGQVLYHLSNIDKTMLEVSNAMNTIATNYKNADETPTVKG